MSKNIAVISDIHGCYKTLCALLDKIRSISPDAEIVFAGDLVDRGPSSRQVVQLVIDNGFKCVSGNHEQMMCTDVLGTTEYPGSWEMNGGKETKKSYEGFPAQLISHSIWMENLPLFLEFKDCVREDGRYLVVSHSHIGKVWDWSEKKRKQNKKQFEQIILWNRGMYEDRKDIYNVVGHTPFPDGPRITSFYANVDTGCVFKRPHYGVLTALIFPTMQIIQQDNID